MIELVVTPDVGVTAAVKLTVDSTNTPDVDSSITAFEDEVQARFEAGVWSVFCC